MSYLNNMAKGYIPHAKPRYSNIEIEFAKKVLFELEDRDLLHILNSSLLYYTAADEQFWQQRSIKKKLYNKPGEMTWKNFYLSQFI